MKSLILCIQVIGLINIAWGWEKCCPDLGCLTNPPPYNDWPEPECPSYATFTLYTRQGSAEPVNLQTFPYSYNGLRRTVFVTHGLAQSAEWDFIRDIKDAILQKEDANVIVIDWKKGGATVYVPKAASNSRAAGMMGAKIAQHLLRLPNSDPRRFWCVGSSTGAHLCGYLGMAMASAGQTIGRVTGLSPAGPGLEDNPDVRIGVNPSSAHFVDIIHSDVSHMLGTKRRLGHHDSYFSGHEFAINLSLKSIFNLQPICEAFCQHLRAIDFFIQSLKQSRECFATTTHCQSETDRNSCYDDVSCWAYAGYYADQSCLRTGIVHLKISPKEPYCTV